MARSADGQGEPSFERDGYTVVGWPFDADTLAIFAGYAMMARSQAKSGANGSTDFDSPITRSLLVSLHPVMEGHTGLALMPAGSFLRLYESGARLPRQTDLPSSDVSASLTIGYDAPHGWPLWVESRGVARACFLDRGDMLICRGREVPHWREPLDGGFWMQAVFHYVDANGPLRGPRRRAHHDGNEDTGEDDAGMPVIDLARAGGARSLATELAAPRY